MHQSLNQQYMLAHDIQFVAEEYFEKACGCVLGLSTVPGLDELADDRHLQDANQIGHEHKPILQQPQSVNGLALIVGGDLPRHLAHTLLNLLGRNHRAQLLRSRTGIHGSEWTHGVTGALAPSAMSPSAPTT